MSYINIRYTICHKYHSYQIHVYRCIYLYRLIMFISTWYTYIYIFIFIFIFILYVHMIYTYTHMFILYMIYTSYLIFTMYHMCVYIHIYIYICMHHIIRTTCKPAINWDSHPSGNSSSPGWHFFQWTTEVIVAGHRPGNETAPVVPKRGLCRFIMGGIWQLEFMMSMYIA